MKRYILLAAAMVGSALTASAQLAEAKTVFVMPMSGGLDQHLIVRLTEEHVLQVVTDPNKADVLLTDRVGSNFEKTITELTAKPVEVKPADGPVTYVTPPMRPLSRSRGTVFLVDRTTLNVLWSTFEEPENTDPKTLRKTAQIIVDRLSKDKH